MDIVSLLKIVIRVAIILLPLISLGLIVTAYSNDLALMVGYMTDNPVILISALVMQKLLTIPAISMVFAGAMISISVVAAFRIF